MNPCVAYTKCMKRLWISLFAFAMLMIGTPALASSETITNFKSISNLDSSDVLHIHEKISVDFGGVSHHGIYRDVPVIRRGAEGAFYYSFALISTSDTVSKSSNGDSVRLRLGDSNTTLSGIHDYTIDYTLSPVALAAVGHDRVFLNVTGDMWEYPILNAQYELTLPAKPISAPVCYAGKSGSTEKFCSISVAGNTITALSTQTLFAGSGLSVDASLPANTFSTYLVANKQPPADLLLSIIFDVLGLVAIALALLGLSLAIKDKLRKRNQTVVAQYEAPDGLAPAQIGLLSDNKVALQELSATMLDLAVRGYMKITQIRAKTWYLRANYRFDKLAEFSGLKNYESLLIDIFFGGADTSVTMADVTARMAASSTSPQKIKDINKQIGQGLKDAGYYSYVASSGSSFELLFHLVFFIIWVTILLSSFLRDTAFGTSIISIIIAAIVIIVQIMFLARRARLTDAGLQEWAKVEGFKLYLKVAESDRINFSDAPAKTPERFNALLPYAVALGVEKEWAKQFEGIDLSQSSSWYAGDPNALGAAAFAGSFSSGFSGAMSSGFSGSSGSGSSGGGGGGGGGGGW